MILKSCLEILHSCCKEESLALKQALDLFCDIIYVRMDIVITGHHKKLKLFMKNTILDYQCFHMIKWGIKTVFKFKLELIFVGDVCKRFLSNTDKNF